MDHKLIRVTAVIAVPDYYGGKAAKPPLCAHDFIQTDSDAFVLDWNETELTVVEETPEG